MTARLTRYAALGAALMMSAAVQAQAPGGTGNDADPATGSIGGSPGTSAPSAQPADRGGSAVKRSQERKEPPPETSPPSVDY
jgi:hypothetical protein